MSEKGSTAALFVGKSAQITGMIFALAAIALFFTDSAEYPTDNHTINALTIFVSLFLVAINGIYLGFVLALNYEEKRHNLSSRFKKALKKSLSEMRRAELTSEINNILLNLIDNYDDFVNKMGGEDSLEFGGAPILAILNQIISTTSMLSQDQESKVYIKQQSMALVRRLIEKSSASITHIESRAQKSQAHKTYLQIVSIAIPVIAIVVLQIFTGFIHLRLFNAH